MLTHAWAFRALGTWVHSREGIDLPVGILFLDHGHRAFPRGPLFGGTDGGVGFARSWGGLAVPSEGSWSIRLVDQRRRNFGRSISFLLLKLSAGLSSARPRDEFFCAPSQMRRSARDSAGECPRPAQAASNMTLKRSKSSSSRLPTALLTPPRISLSAMLCNSIWQCCEMRHCSPTSSKRMSVNIVKSG